MVFGLKSKPACIESKDRNKFSFWTIINQDMLSFVSLGVLGENAKLLFVSSPSP
jgi:hypothetical protein